MKTPPATLHILKPGTFTAVDGSRHTITAENLADLVNSYNPELAEAPIVVGHPKALDAPAYGWAAGLELRDGDAFAQPRQVDPEFAEMVNTGRFKTISASIYLPTSPGNPRPGHYYLRHIGFLGAQPPAVKGLRPAQFAAADDGAVEFSQPLEGLGWTLRDLFQRLRDRFLEKEGSEIADQVIPQFAINSISDLLRDNGQDRPAFAEPLMPVLEPEMPATPPPADFAEREASLVTRAADLDQREQQLAEREALARRAEAADFAQGLADAGRLLPRQVAPVIELLMALPASQVLDFAEGDSPVQKPSSEVLRTLLGEMPVQIRYDEKSADPAAGAIAGLADFAAPPGATVDLQQLELHQLAVNYQREHPDVSFLAAFKAVGGR